ncbi:hypothetical protein H6G94_17910 [Nostoc punctiforme FACHB-252]|jgi:hypothetical protein|uniref:Uncharacterized protein n=1 Tax=Nostoc punctiforme FACHB-252 TaxID=1357509 RepID=A0ABR8HBE1_NOSPU|nr:hypothetical protein [Nostoc punctiforme]MBD2613127.1 hypothetical protein [Nostoc punctiforme FACHB-252]
MLKTKHSQLYWLGAGISLAVISAAIAPASADIIIIDSGSGIRRSCEAACRQTSPAVGSFIYGSPIPTPMPVDPATGLTPQRIDYYNNYSYPVVRQRVRNSTIINPTLVNPTIRNSTLVNPVIINNSWRRTPFSGGRSRVIITYPR